MGPGAAGADWFYPGFPAKLPELLIAAIWRTNKRLLFRTQ
jgi:hypothetical protein